MNIAPISNIYRCGCHGEVECPSHFTRAWFRPRRASPEVLFLAAVILIATVLHHMVTS